MKKVKLADVLWEAANNLLWDGSEPNPRDGCEWSCNAALAAEMGARFHYEYAIGNVENFRHQSEATRYLAQLGADPHVAAALGGNEEQRQGVRYMWLLLAMHVAEDEDIEIEVSKC
jgi:hypothetical protein